MPTSDTGTVSRDEATLAASARDGDQEAAAIAPMAWGGTGIATAFAAGVPTAVVVGLIARSLQRHRRRAMDETERRRTLQMEHNKKNNITPESIKKAIRTSLESEVSARHTAMTVVHAPQPDYDRSEIMAKIEQEMLAAADELDITVRLALCLARAHRCDKADHSQHRGREYSQPHGASCHASCRHVRRPSTHSGPRAVNV